MQFCERLKLLRKQKGLTQNAVASILGIAKSTYVKYERGEREPRYGTLVALTEIFQVSIDYLLGKSETDSVYKERINDVYNYISSEEFMQEHRNNIDNINKLISDYLRLLYILSDNDPMLDLLYVITELEGVLIELYRTGLHIFCHDKFAEGDAEYKEVVDAPCKNDLVEFISQSLKAKKMLDDYIALLSDESYFLDSHLKYEKDINNYSSVDLIELLIKFRTDKRYKMKTDTSSIENEK